MVDQLSSDKLIAYAIATTAGALASVSCWGWRSLSQRSLRRPLASVCVHSSLGAVSGLALSLAVEMAWECNLPGKVMVAILAGAIVSIWGPDVLIRVVVTELILYFEARAMRSIRSRRRDGEDIANQPDDEAGNQGT